MNAGIEVLPFTIEDVCDRYDDGAQDHALRPAHVTVDLIGALPPFGHAIRGSLPRLAALRTDLLDLLRTLADDAHLPSTHYVQILISVGAYCATTLLWLETNVILKSLRRVLRNLMKGPEALELYATGD